jgi:hypothetical protein
MTTNTKIPKALRPAIQSAQGRGWNVERTNGGHLKLTHPKYGVAFTSSSPSDWRVVRNLDARLRRMERAA